MFFAILLFFAQKIIIYVLFMLRLFLLPHNHLFIRARSQLMYLFIFLSDLFAKRRLVS